MAVPDSGNSSLVSVYFFWLMVMKNETYAMITLGSGNVCDKKRNR